MGNAVGSPLGSLQHSPDPLIGFKRQGLGPKEVEGREGLKGTDGREKGKRRMVLPQSNQQFLDPPLRNYYLQFKQFPFVNSLLFGQVK